MELSRLQWWWSWTNMFNIFNKIYWPNKMHTREICCLSTCYKWGKTYVIIIFVQDHGSPQTFSTHNPLHPSPKFPRLHPLHLPYFFPTKFWCPMLFPLTAFWVLPAAIMVVKPQPPETTDLGQGWMAILTSSFLSTNIYNLTSEYFFQKKRKRFK